MVPLFVPLIHSCFSSGALVVWSIIARSTSSNSPNLMSSGLPPRNSILPSRRRESRYSISMYSSAGTAINTSRPLSSDRTSLCINARAAPKSMPIWQWWPQAWAAPVVGSAWGCSLTINESSSPRMARVGPAVPPTSSARTPVKAKPALKGMLISANLLATKWDVLVSRNPGSGFFRMVWVRLIISSARASISSNARRFNSSLDGIESLLG